jgi:hypothetical protein
LYLDKQLLCLDQQLMHLLLLLSERHQRMASALYRHRLIPSYMSVQVMLRDGTVTLEAASAFKYHVAFQDVGIFQVAQWMGQLISRVHVSAHNVTLLEEKVGCSSDVKPVLYKNPLGVATAPMLFVGIDIVDQTQEMREIKVELHCSNVMARYDVTSKWPLELAKLFVLKYPLLIISLDSASTTDAEYQEYQELLHQLETKRFRPVELVVPTKTVFSKVFVSFYDAVVDYPPLLNRNSELPPSLGSLTWPRMMLVLGHVSLSSNVVSGAMIQGYKVMVRDLQLYLTPNGPTYDEMDAHVLGKELLKRAQNVGVRRGEFMRVLIRSIH